MSDADLAGDPATRRSRSGKIIMLNGGCLTIKSKLQTVIQLSTCAAEIVTMSDVAHDVMAYRHILSELGHSQTLGTLLLCDNKAALAITKEHMILRAASKHLDMRVLKVREFQAMSQIAAHHCATRELWADLLTKNLSSVLFRQFRDGITGYTNSLVIGYEQELVHRVSESILSFAIASVS